MSYDAKADERRAIRNEELRRLWHKHEDDVLAAATTIREARRLSKIGAESLQAFCELNAAPLDEVT